MATFLLFGKYSPQAIGEMSTERTASAVEVIEKFGGEVQSMFATLGVNDLLFVLSFPSTDDAIKASIALTRMTGIAFTTSPAVTVAEFDRLIGEI
ncbi:MAG: GYD domain-containing protein [Planctomycetota bacterium]